MTSERRLHYYEFHMDVQILRKCYQNLYLFTDTVAEDRNKYQPLVSSASRQNYCIHDNIIRRTW